MNKKELAEFVARLPAHLRFFFEPPPADLDAEELVKFANERFAKVRQYREELIAHGIAADRYISENEGHIRELEKANAKVAKAEDTYLTATADRADAEYKLFQEMKKALAQMEQEKPFDPQVQELREQLEEFAKQFPKEES